MASRQAFLKAGDPALTAQPDLAVARSLLSRFEPPDMDQNEVRERILAFIDRHPHDAHQRSCREGHLTASALVLDAAGQRALLTHHAKLDKWLQLGGHCDGDANLPGVALREACEESGIATLAIDPRPIDVDIHQIPERPGEPAHLHLDTRFLVRASEPALPRRNHESHELRWLSFAEAMSLACDDSLGRLLRRAVQRR